MTYPHVPAAFINAIAEEGTKDDAVRKLQELWNENCALKNVLQEIRKYTECSWTYGTIDDALGPTS